MPRFKRLQKKKNSDSSISTSQGAEVRPSFNQSMPCLSAHPSMSFLGTTHMAPAFQPTSQAAPTFQPASQPSQSVHSTPHPASMNQAASQRAPTVHPTSQPSLSIHSTSHPTPTVQATSKRPYGRESTTHWTVEAIDSEENVKKLKLKVRDVLNLTGDERIVVNFDYLDEPFGEARSLLSGFCGILACDCALFPINFEKWLSLPISYFNRVFDQIIKPKFFFKTIDSVARRHVYKSIGKKWAANKLNLWNSVEDPLKSRAKIIDSPSIGISPDQWISFVDYQYKESTKEMRKRNAENRKKQTIPHTGGSKANTTRRAEIMDVTGHRPGRAQIYIATHKNRDGVYVNEAAKEICEKIELALNQSTIDESQISPNDAVGKVLGKEHSGRVRCLGLGPVPSRVFNQIRPRFGGTSASSNDGSCSSHCQENHNQMMNAHNQMMNAFKAYMIMKEGTIPEQFAGFFASPSTVSPTTPSDASSGPLSPMGARRSCGDSNRSDDNC